MSLIDVAIPQFGDDGNALAKVERPAIMHEKSSALMLKSGFFAQPEKDYSLDDDNSDSREAHLPVSTSNDDDEFFEAETGDDGEVRKFLCSLT